MDKIWTYLCRKSQTIEATLLDANPQYGHIRLASGTEITVNIRDIAPHHKPIDQSHDNRINVGHLNDENNSLNENSLLDNTRSDMINDTNNTDVTNVNYNNDNININRDLNEAENENTINKNDFVPRKSSKIKKMPQKYDDYITR